MKQGRCFGNLGADCVEARGLTKPHDLHAPALQRGQCRLRPVLPGQHKGGAEAHDRLRICADGGVVCGGVGHP